MNSEIIVNEELLLKNNERANIIFADSTTSFSKLKNIIQEFKDVRIIVFDIDLRKKLLKNNISHIISDEFLSENDLELIQNEAYNLSKWFDQSEINSELIFENVNIGRLFHEQFAEFLVKFLRKYRVIYNFYKKYSNCVFFASGILFDIINSFSDSSKKIEEEIKETNFIFDKVRVDFKVGNRYFMILISRKLYLKLKKLSEIFINLFFGPKKKINGKSSLLVEIHTDRYKKLLLKSKSESLSLFFYGRRRPAIWNFDTYKIFKKSDCKIISSQVLKDNRFEINKDAKINELKIQIEKLWKNDEFFTKFFSNDGISSWSIIKPTLMNLINNRIEEVVNEIELVKRLFKKFRFNSVVVFQEVGLTEQIVISQAKQFDIPIVLLQQGLYYDTEEAKTANKVMTVYPRNADKFAVWGEISKSDALKNAKLSDSRIEVIGAPRYDNEEFWNLTSKKEYVLLAAQGPAYNYVQGHQIKNFEDYEDAISKICKILLEHNKKIVIKLHPSPREFDITNYIKNINSEIDVVTTGDIIPLIKSCSMMISMGLSTSIIEAQILHKPVIIVPVVDYKMGVPEIFKNNYSTICSPNNFEEKLRKMLENNEVEKEMIKKGDDFMNKYLANPKNATESFIELLKTL
ncbi:MAG: hypothetical protein K5798_05200 [Nitrosopumilus sp.]|uniref:hypothetical protein n=1 Tax=Nitrosopumilus sp. TaxID=2024843 RepID=UPI00242C5AB1|nr:hypothetical protein [Nitrosopumilus sp.]MCV0366641.1 hypothetical protein [Nitrosopumilus sp.]